MKGKKRVERLTPRLRQTYQALINLEDGLGAPPSVREVVGELGLDKDYISRVHGDIQWLVKLGLAARLSIPTRQYKAIGPPPDEIDWEALLDP